MLQTPLDVDHSAPNGKSEVEAAVEGVAKNSHEQIADLAAVKCPKAQIIICAMSESQRVDEDNQSQTTCSTQVDQVVVPGCVSDHATHYVTNLKIGIVSLGPNLPSMLVAQATVGDDETSNADVSVDVSNDLHDTNGAVPLKIRVLCSCKSCAFLIGTCPHLETLSNSQVGSSDGTIVVILGIANG